MVNDQNVFGIRRIPHTVICPMSAIERYIEIAPQMGVDLTRGYLFRPNPPIKGFKIFLYVLSSRSWPEGLFTTNACP